MVRLFALFFSLIASSAWADADYPVYDCDGPELRLIPNSWLYPEEIAQLYPDLGPTSGSDLAVFADDSGIAWTQQTRDELRALCLERWDQAHLPRSGMWSMSVAPYDEAGCTGPLTEPAIGSFPRRLTFGEVFHPHDVVSLNVLEWKFDRYPNDLIWGTYAGQQQGLTDLRALAVSFVTVLPEVMEIDLYVAVSVDCHANFLVTLQREGD